MLDDPHLISHVRQTLKQVNFYVLRGKDTLPHFSPLEISATQANLALKLSNVSIKLSAK